MRCTSVPSTMRSARPFTPCAPGSSPRSLRSSRLRSGQAVQAWLKATTDSRPRRSDKGRSACYAATTQGKAGEGSWGSGCSLPCSVVSPGSLTVTFSCRLVKNLRSPRMAADTRHAPNQLASPVWSTIIRRFHLCATASTCARILSIPLASGRARDKFLSAVHNSKPLCCANFTRAVSVSLR
jgi:hypothetical protein